MVTWQRARPRAGRAGRRRARAFAAASLLLDGRVRSCGAIRQLGSGARAQRTAVTQCGTSLPNFPNLPGPEATFFLLIFLLGVVSPSPPARQVTAFPESGRWGWWGKGSGLSSRHCPSLRRAAGGAGGRGSGDAGQQTLGPRPPRLSCRGESGQPWSQRRKAGASDSPLRPSRGFGPRARRPPGGWSAGRAPWGRGARGWSRGADSFPFPSQPGLRRTPGRHGLLHPRCHLFSGTVTTQGVKAGAPLQNTSPQAGSLSPGFVLSPRAVLLVFPARGHFFPQYLKPRCGVDSGCLINDLDRFAWNARHARRGIGWGCGGRRQASCGSGFELRFFLQA